MIIFIKYNKFFEYLKKEIVIVCFNPDFELIKKINENINKWFKSLKFDQALIFPRNIFWNSLIIPNLLKHYKYVVFFYKKK